MPDNSITSTRGLALWCSADGVVVNVLHNDLGLAESALLGKSFPTLVAPSDFPKALSFLVELRARGTIFDWEFDLLLEDRVTLAHCVGLMIDHSMLIIAAQTRSAVQHLFEDMMRINNDQANLLRAITKEQVELVRGAPDREIRLYEELSGINNELVSLQRELAKKNMELEQLYAEVQRLSVIDELTHRYNRRGFFDVARREFARAQRSQLPLGAIMLDIDHFKRFNDTYGHAIGDRVLKEVAFRCGAQLRQVDMLGRYGGDEFSVLLPETSLPGGRVIAERLRQHVNQDSLLTDYGPLTVNISLGVVSLADGMTSIDALLEAADQALYQAKAAGRNRVFVQGE